MPCDVSGMGIVCALGTGLGEVGANLYSIERNFVPAPSIHKDALDLPFFAARLNNRRHSARDTLELARLAAKEAIAMAGWSNLEDCAVIVGTTSGTALHFLESYKAGKPGADSRDYMLCNPALALAEELGAKGPAMTISNACTSGTDAIGFGLGLLQSGQAEKALCGGADAFSLVAHTGFARLMLYDGKPCAPFDAARKGLNLGEGAAFLCLEKNAAKPFGRVAGCASRSDAWHLTAPHPQGLGLRLAIENALRQAGLKPADIEFINAHATATRENDKVEGQTLKNIFASAPVWASKAVTGHTLGAAGAIEAVLSLLALKNGLVPRSVGFSSPDDEIGLAPGRSETRIQGKYAVSTSLGFGGGNAALVLEGASWA